MDFRMKKLVIISDSHGNTLSIKRVIKANKDADYIIHLGDSSHDVLEVQREFGTNMIVVKGNCEFYSSIPTLKVIDIENVKLLLVHGHKQKVKFSLIRLKLLAQEKKANLVLYGHTHIQKHDKNKIDFLNPGSISSGRYAIVTLNDGKFDIELCRL